MIHAVNKNEDGKGAREKRVSDGGAIQAETRLRWHGGWHVVQPEKRDLDEEGSLVCFRRNKFSSRGETQSDWSHPRHSHQPGPSHCCLPPGPLLSPLAGLQVSVSCLLWSIFHTGSLSGSYKMRIDRVTTMCKTFWELPSLRTALEVLPLTDKLPRIRFQLLLWPQLPTFPLCSLTGLLALPWTGSVHTCLGLSSCNWTVIHRIAPAMDFWVIRNSFLFSQSTVNPPASPHRFTF